MYAEELYFHCKFLTNTRLLSPNRQQPKYQILYDLVFQQEASLLSLTALALSLDKGRSTAPWEQLLRFLLLLPAGMPGEGMIWRRQGGVKARMC